MKNNKKIRFLGFLGFLGLLGIYTKNYGFFGFFGFFSFFAAASKSDERLSGNAYKAGFYSFVISLIGLSFLVTALSLQTGIALMSLIIATVFLLTIVTFVASFILAEKGVLN